MVGLAADKARHSGWQIARAPAQVINSPSLLRQQAHQRDATCKICRTARTAEALDDDGVHFGSAVAGPDDQLNEYLPNYPMDKDLSKAISVHPRYTLVL